MSKLEKFIKSLRRSSRKPSYFNSFFKGSKIPFLKYSNFLLNKKSRKNFHGNIEFMIFLGITSFIVYRISKNRELYSKTTRLIATGIVTHLIVDLLTYFGDKLNTEIKINSFKNKTLIDNINNLSISNFFKDKFYFNYNLYNNAKRKNKINPHSKAKSSNNMIFSNYISNYKGIQSGVIYLVFNSILFYAIYKEIKSYMKNYYHIEGFINFFTAAGIAQLIAMTFSFPLENLKTRMQASSFNYDTIVNYYKKLIVKKPYSVIKANLRKEYSGFFSHLTLYVIFEAFIFGIYESMMDYMNKNELFTYKKLATDDLINNANNKEASTGQILIASSVSGILAAVITNPIDVYQINKQINPDFNMNELNKSNIFVGVKERSFYILICSILTFYFLEKIGPRYFDVRLEDE